MQSPLEQFEIRPLIPLHLGGYDVSFTNSTLFMAIALALIGLIFVIGTSRKALVPGRLQSAAELLYEFVVNMVDDNTGHGGRKFVPLVFTIFVIVLFGNVLGLIPYSFTYTSHIIVTFALALLVAIVVLLASLRKHGIHFFAMFLPAGVPVFLSPLIVPIEIVSYIFRPISLSVRLFANMMAGHIMLQVFAGFTVALGLFGVLPLVFIIALIGFEIIVVLLQAYVFAILTSIYLRDATEGH
jgi:F-type H+-transporting ATPase subunit a